MKKINYNSQLYRVFFRNNFFVRMAEFFRFKICRPMRFVAQRLTKGWDDSDTWSLDLTIAEFVLPRLKRFKEVNNGYPGNMTAAQWDEILDKMIYAMEMIACDDITYNKADVEEIKDIGNRVDEGCRLFGEYFQGLWW